MKLLASLLMAAALATPAFYASAAGVINSTWGKTVLPTN